MSLFKPPRSPFYYYDFQYKGCRFAGSTKETTLRTAKKVENEKRNQAVVLSRTQQNALPENVNLDWVVRELITLREEVQSLRAVLESPSVGDLRLSGQKPH